MHSTEVDGIVSPMCPNVSGGIKNDKPSCSVTGILYACYCSLQDWAKLPGEIQNYNFSIKECYNEIVT